MTGSYYTQNGGSASVSNLAPIVTTGTGAPGIVAQSVGGGGGISFIGSNNVPTVTATAGNGIGGVVNVYVNAPITTSGAHADGVIAQSVGGGGGLLLGDNGVTAALTHEKKHLKSNSVHHI